MCTALFGFDAHPLLLLLLVMNRDEFLQREAQPAHFWPDAPDVLAGRDVVSAGTWLGASRSSGRFAFLTNYREGDAGLVDKGTVQSRGSLVTGFLRSDASPVEYLQSLDCGAYDGFNLVVGTLGDTASVAYINNRDCVPTPLSAGIHGVSNGPLDSQRWPKVAEGKKALETYLHSLSPFDPTELDLALAVEQLLNSRHKCFDADLLPHTPYGLGVEIALSSIFIEPMQLKGRPYGTRSQVAVAVQRDGRVLFFENFLSPDGQWRPARHEFYVDLGSSGSGDTANEL